MIYMGMRQNNCAEFVDRDRKYPVLGGRIVSFPLKHSAIQSDGLAAHFQEMTGASYFPCRACKSDFQLGFG